MTKRVIVCLLFYFLVFLISICLEHPICVLWYFVGGYVVGTTMKFWD